MYIKELWEKWISISLILRILIGLIIGIILGLLIPGLPYISILGTAFIASLKAVATAMIGIGFIIGVIQDSLETALNSSSDVLFTVTVDDNEKKKAAKAAAAE